MCYHRFMAHTLSDEEDGVAAYLEKCDELRGLLLMAEIIIG